MQLPPFPAFLQNGKEEAGANGHALEDDDVSASDGRVASLLGVWCHPAAAQLQVSHAPPVMTLPPFTDEAEGDEDDDLGSEEESLEEEESEEVSEEETPAAPVQPVGSKRKPQPAAAKPAPKQAKAAAAATPTPAPATAKPAAEKKEEPKKEAKPAATPKKRTFPNGFEIETLKQVWLCACICLCICAYSVGWECGHTLHSSCRTGCATNPAP
jgi:hypothetical protein